MLGGLLASALFPPDILLRLVQQADSDYLLIRLKFDDACELFNVPWEFVTVKIEGTDRHVAVEPNMGIVRLGPHRNEANLDVAPRKGAATVLSIIMHPEAWGTRMPRFTLSNRTIDWPGQRQVREKFVKALGGLNQWKPSLLENPYPSAVPQRIEELEDSGPIEVVHYIGFGQIENNEPMIAFSDGDEDVEWRKLTDFFGWVAKSRARLLIVEFLLPRSDTDPEHIPPRAFLSALAGHVNAVIYTRFPVHPRQCDRFNQSLYEALNRGSTVEVAVQRARKEMFDNQLLEDAASFGLFSLLTGPKADLQLVGSNSGAQPQGDASGRSSASTTYREEGSR